jgi:hypothetical protein
MPFWRAALGYEPRIDSPAEDLVGARIAAALAAGGRMVRDEFAP